MYNTKITNISGRRERERMWYIYLFERKPTK